tara:strand:+ start:2360 stop:3142 length:783 start_codon:yes stop_codon:yes gene_type:complete
MKKQKPLVSILIVNYNNSKYIGECLNSINSQTYKEIEIIFFDDNSNDNSLDVIKKYENVKIIDNKFHSKFGSINQMNGFKKSFSKSTGDIIFLLDSDDYFTNNKVEKVVDYFQTNHDKNVIFDYPIIKKGFKEKTVKKKINIYKSYWGYIHPTSCISLRREYLEKIFHEITDEKFLDIWMDLRILLFSKYIDKYNVIDDNLTFYRQFDGNVSSKFQKYNKFWWKRRNEAHDYFFYFMKKNNLKINKNLDFYITKLINKFL